MGHTAITNSAVLGPKWPHDAARMTQPQYITVPLTLPLIVVGDLFDGPVVLFVVFGKKSRVFLVGDQKADPHHYVHDQESVVGLRQDVPGHGNALKINQLEKKRKMITSS